MWGVMRMWVVLLCDMRMWVVLLCGSNLGINGVGNEDIAFSYRKRVSKTDIPDYIVDPDGFLAKLVKSDFPENDIEHLSIRMPDEHRIDYLNRLRKLHPDYAILAQEAFNSKAGRYHSSIRKTKAKLVEEYNTDAEAFSRTYKKGVIKKWMRHLGVAAVDNIVTKLGGEALKEFEERRTHKNNKAASYRKLDPDGRKLLNTKNKQIQRAKTRDMYKQLSVSKIKNMKRKGFVDNLGLKELKSIIERFGAVNPEFTHAVEREIKKKVEYNKRGHMNRGERQKKLQKERAAVSAQPTETNMPEERQTKLREDRGAVSAQPKETPEAIVMKESHYTQYNVLRREIQLCKERGAVSKRPTETNEVRNMESKEERQAEADKLHADLLKASLEKLDVYPPAQLKKVCKLPLDHLKVIVTRFGEIASAVKTAVQQEIQTKLREERGSVSAQPTETNMPEERQKKLREDRGAVSAQPTETNMPEERQKKLREDRGPVSAQPKETPEAAILLSGHSDAVSAEAVLNRTVHNPTHSTGHRSTTAQHSAPGEQQYEANKSPPASPKPRKRPSELCAPEQQVKKHRMSPQTSEQPQNDPKRPMAAYCNTYWKKWLIPANSNTEATGDT